MDAPEQNDSKLIGHPTEPQRRILWTALTALAVLAMFGVAGLVFFGFVAFLSWCYPILLPIGLAVLIALVLEPAVAFAQRRRGMKRETAALAVCVLTVVAIVLFWTFLSGTVINSTATFFKQLPDNLTRGVDKLDKVMNGGSGPEILPPSLHEKILPDVKPIPGETNVLTLLPKPPLTNGLEMEREAVAVDASAAPTPALSLQAWLKSNLPAIEQTVQKNVANVIYSAIGPVGQAFGFLLGFGFVPIYVYYFLADEEVITKHWHEYVPLRRSRLRDEVVAALAEISASLVNYLRGQIIVAACNGVLTFLGLWIIGLGFQNSLVLGIITGSLSIVPFLGIICSIIPAVLIAFLTPVGDIVWLRPLLVLGVFALVQMSESMFITPRVQSHSTGLHPLTIIIGILFWSMLLPGLLGPIVGVPLTCTAVVLLRRYVWLEKLEEKEAG
jgi:predicted PurR-regulated permease PerM